MHSLSENKVKIQPHGFFTSLRRMLPRGQVIRFLMVGGFNTLFALALYDAFVYLYTHLLIHHSQPFIADVANITAKPIGITVAFLCYKHFVFRTQGNYLKEWLRCFTVYGVSFPAELVILPVVTHLFLRVSHTYAPYIAGIVNSAIIASYSYFAHKKFSFKR
jgi:putative flippase GtrA